MTRYNILNLAHTIKATGPWVEFELDRDTKLARPLKMLLRKADVLHVRRVAKLGESSTVRKMSRETQCDLSAKT